MASTDGVVPPPSPPAGGPHRSELLNKLDPRVSNDHKREYDGSYGDKTAYGTVNTSTPSRVSQGSSTGAPGIAHVDDHRNAYDPRTTHFNSATGSGFSTAGERETELQQRGHPGTVHPEHWHHHGTETNLDSWATRTSERAGSGITGLVSGVHVSRSLSFFCPTVQGTS